MPCNECGNILGVSNSHSDQRDKFLFCPNCLGLDLEAQPIVTGKTNYLINKSRFTVENIPKALQDYRKHDVLYYLISRLNKRSYDFFDRNGFQIFEFGYLARLVRGVLCSNYSGQKRIENYSGFDEDITILRNSYAILQRLYLDANDQFIYCEKKDGTSVDANRFTKDYSFIYTEKWLAFRRIAESMFCADYDEYEIFSKVMDDIRYEIDYRSRDTPETIEEFGDYWYELIVQLKVIASVDEMISGVYYSNLTPEITINYINDFLSNLDNSLSLEQAKNADNGYPVTLDKKTVEKAGKDAFGGYWPDVRDEVIVSKNKPEGHPFLFKLEHTDQFSKADSTGMATVRKTAYLYPQHYARLIKYQVYPLLRNKNAGPTGHEIIKSATEKRTKRYEENFYKYLKQHAQECYLRPEITDSDGSELDIILTTDDEVHFIELKLFVPTINLRASDGLRVIDEKFDLEIFNEEPTTVNRSPSGPTLPEKIGMWLDLDVDDSFNSDKSTPLAKAANRVTDHWEENDIKVYVVSNLTPTYIKRQNIEFLTDVEYISMFEKDETVISERIFDGPVTKVPDEKIIIEED
ncbi:hypothetical protein [Natronosalvus amylolyticus]|uniref:hypothetical protein n=1 Tax=Natronosalvus amylolyticus TaxID=2961994 RepID=UPI0020C9A96E|nr:hypothetical protein [Natronosalvus amylolyticus]